MDTGVRNLEVVDLWNRTIYAVLNTHNLDMILQPKYKYYSDSNESGQNRLEWLQNLEMLWSELHFI